MSQDLDKVLEDAFKSEAATPLKTGFDQRVLMAINRKKKRAQRQFILGVSVGACLILAAIAFLVGMYQVQIAAYAAYFQAIAGFSILLLLLQVLDKKLVKDRLLLSEKDHTVN